MNASPTPEELARWQRRLAAQANNRAWALSEQSVRTPEEDEAMLHAAHAAMHFWTIVGDENALAHAAQLLALVLAKLGQAEPAARYLRRSAPVLASDAAAPWERALAHAVAAQVAAAIGDATGHRDHHRQAREQTAALPDPEERAILEATLRAVPVPEAGS